MGRTISDLSNIEKRTARYFNTTNSQPSSDNKEVFLEEPRMCMHCRNTGQQKYIELALITGTSNKYDAVGIYGCEFCKETTISFYNYEDILVPKEMEFDKTYVPILVTRDYLPKDLTNISISKKMQTNYNDFYEIYSQAKVAEENDLYHLAGMGYRKSIEFLVTDFLKDYSEDENVTVEWLENASTRLGNKIKKLPSKKLRNIANAISYLGNDEAHYTIRHPDYDISDMKRFIALLINEFESEFIYEDIENFIG